MLLSANIFWIHQFEWWSISFGDLDFLRLETAVGRKKTPHSLPLLFLLTFPQKLICFGLSRLRHRGVKAGGFIWKGNPRKILTHLAKTYKNLNMTAVQSLPVKRGSRGDGPDLKTLNLSVVFAELESGSLTYGIWNSRKEIKSILGHSWAGCFFLEVVVLGWYMVSPEWSTQEDVNSHF